MKAKHVGFIGGAVFLFASFVGAQIPGVRECSEHRGIDFQIAADRLVYAPKSMMHVKFLVTNTDYTERRGSSTGLYSFRDLYLYRLLSDCTSQVGFYRLTILDKNNKHEPIQGCSIDHQMDKVDAVQLFTDPKTGIALSPGDVYGIESGFDLPAKKGTYHLKAELFTGDFNKKQQQALAERKMWVLPPDCTIPAPVVTITVK